MSPELFVPERFGLKDGCAMTKSSDCYALGMVIYEVLSGQVPFALHRGYAVIRSILKGERPKRPQGVERRLFTDDIWKILECCWKPEPGDCPSIDGMLQCLVEASRFWTPLSPALTGEDTHSLACGSPDLSTEESTDDEEESAGGEASKALRVIVSGERGLLEETSKAWTVMQFPPIK